MFATIKQIFSPRNKDLRKRILFTLFVLLIFKVGTAITVPGTSSITKDLGFLELWNAMSGGALESFSIFALGVGPYINASIITQLLQMDIIPYFSDLKNQGATGRRKINEITRYLGIAIAFVQGYVFSFTIYGQTGGAMEYLRIAIILTAGTSFLLWLGDQVTKKGVGNGISLMIMAGIVANMPNMFISVFKNFVHFSTWQSTLVGLLIYLVFILLYIFIIVGVIFIDKAERRLPLQYANRTTSAYGGEQTYIPIRLNSAGVMPVIFASVLISIPATVANFVKNTGFTNFVNNYLTYTKPVGFILYVLLIFAFAYFYTFMQINPKELSTNLKNNGGYIPGIKPGKSTENYISKVLNRLTIVGALFLVVLAAIPILCTLIPNMPKNVTIGGTGLLIVVGVALETYNQIENILVSRNYSRSYR